MCLLDAKKLLQTIAPRQSHKSIGVDLNLHPHADYRVAVTYIGLGLVAIVLGIVSYIRKESHRVAGMPGALGIVATAWEYVLIGLIIAVDIMILANLNISV